MKKMMSLFMIFLITFSTINPVPIFADEASEFPGDVKGSVVVNNMGTVTVNMNDKSSDIHWGLSLRKAYSQNDQQAYLEGHTVVFDDVPAGLYYIIATETVAGKQIKYTSKQYEVKPEILIASTAPVSNIILPTPEPRVLEVTGVTGQYVRLYNNDNLTTHIKELNVTNAGVKFDKLDASGKYQVTQVVNGAESEPSNYITVHPNSVTIERIKDSGPSNKAGEILIKNAKQGNTLVLYINGNTVEREAEKIPTSEYTFKELPAGKYIVKHFENGIESKSDSNEVVIRNEQVPIINVKGTVNSVLRYTIIKDGEGVDKNRVIPVKYDELGYIVTDKNGKTYEGKTNAFFCDGKDEGNAQDTCTLLKMKVEVVSTVKDSDNSTLPGEYTVTYTATDGGDENLSSTIVRNVTVHPNDVNLTKLDTNEADVEKALHFTNRKTGEITAYGVYQGATLKLYQDSADGTTIEVPVRPENVNEGEFTFKGVPVGTGYFVAQEVNGVQSSPSKRVDILDTTPPELKLNGEEVIMLEVGDRYIEQGATAEDNIDTPEDLSSKIQISGDTVDTNIPGTYLIVYNVKDKAGNDAVGKDGKTPAAIRTVHVNPRPLTAIGGIATIGEIGVKDIFPGNDKRKTLLNLYKYLKVDNSNEYKFQVIATTDLDNNQITHVFSKHGPGRYYVTQTVNGRESRQSNIVEIVDVDRPYITLTGPEKLSFVLGEVKDPYFKASNVFEDPGAKADDYLEADKLTLTATMLKPDGIEKPYTLPGYSKEIKFKDNNADPKLDEPGIYKITYTAEADRGSIADPKHRTITLAPPKVTGVKAGAAGKGLIEASGASEGVFNHLSTTVTLYNAFGQAMDSQEASNKTAVTFTNVPAGLGYYMTQTVNGIESAPSDPVNVTLFEDAEQPALMHSFEFSAQRAYGTIDHRAGTISVVVPKNTDVKKLKAEYTATGPVTVVNGGSGTAERDFTIPVTYRVTVPTKDDKTVEKDYTVTVEIAQITTNAWTTTINKIVSFSASKTQVTLSPAEKSIANEKGISLIGKDRAIHVPPANVANSMSATLSVRTPNTVTTTADPSWKSSINNPTEIQWGLSNQPFLQPIEIEMPNPDKKQFAKLVRDNGKLYAVIQPSENQSGNLIGLATESGMYALIDDIAKPNIKTVSDGIYSLSTNVLGATIYYTTGSSEVAFDRSARKPDQLKSYFLDGPPSDLSKWKVAKNNEHVSVPNGELYAFVMKDQMISPLNSIEAKMSVEWKKDIPTYPTHKVLSITFNTKVDKKALYAGTVYVIDDSTGKEVGTTLSLSADGKTISVAPKKAYTRGHQYTLHIDRQFKGNTKNNEFLKQPLTRTFTIK